MGALGDSIAGIEREPIAPTARNAAVETAALGAPKSATPKSTVSASAAGGEKSLSKEEVETNKALWKQYLSDPRIRAGFLQMGVNLIAGQNFGTAAGGGLAAIGRAGQTEKDQAEDQRKLDLEERRVAAAEAAAKARTSGGGGGVGSGRAGSGKLTGYKGWLDMVSGSGLGQQVDDFGEVTTPGMSQIEMSGIASDLATIEAMGGNSDMVFRLLLDPATRPDALAKMARVLGRADGVAEPTAPNAADSAFPTAETTSTEEGKSKGKKEFKTAEQAALELVPTPEAKEADRVSSFANALGSTIQQQLPGANDSDITNFILNTGTDIATLQQMKQLYPQWTKAIDAAISASKK